MEERQKREEGSEEEGENPSAWARLRCKGRTTRPSRLSRECGQKGESWSNSSTRCGPGGSPLLRPLDQ